MIRTVIVPLPVITVTDVMITVYAVKRVHVTRVTEVMSASVTTPIAVMTVPVSVTNAPPVRNVIFAIHTVYVVNIWMATTDVISLQLVMSVIGAMNTVSVVSRSAVMKRLNVKYVEDAMITVFAATVAMV